MRVNCSNLGHTHITWVATEVILFNLIFWKKNTNIINLPSIFLQTFLDILPQLILVGTLFECTWQLHVSGADVPEQNTEGVHVHTAVVATGEELRRHVNGSSHNAPTHHGLWLTESQIGQLGSVLLVQLLKVSKTALLHQILLLVFHDNLFSCLSGFKHVLRHIVFIHKTYGNYGNYQ